MKSKQIPKDKIYIFLFVIAWLFIAGFAIRLGVDYFKDYPYGSAPFYVYVIIRAIEFLIPSAICFVLGEVTKKNKAKDETK